MESLFVELTFWSDRQRRKVASSSQLAEFSLPSLSSCPSNSADTEEPTGDIPNPRLAARRARARARPNGRFIVFESEGLTKEVSWGSKPC